MLALFRKPAPIPPLPLNQSTHPADGPVYRQFQIVWISKHTFPPVFDLKFGVAVRTDFFTWIGIRERIETERAFHREFFWVNSKTFFLAGTCII